MAAVASGFIRLSYSPPGGSPTSIDLKVTSIKGMDKADISEFGPDIVNTGLDGSMESQFMGFTRKIRVVIDNVYSITSQLAILYFLLDNARTIDYGSESGIVVVPQSTDFENEWLNELSLTPRYTLELEESSLRQVFPV